MNIVSPDRWAINVQNVTKRFSLSTASRSLKTTIVDLLTGRRAKAFTALEDVSFQVQKGETVGLIGHNGAGKSTLLSIIAHTITPTKGSVTVHGSISSLLELGAGFHPDLTGRENVLLYGAIMGIPRETMKKRFDEIVEFSGLRDFIDQPVRFYSSGMYVRLGFSVAVQVDPDILLVDEVLAVGDTEFQQKCLDKMDQFRRENKSMLLISHDINTIRRVSNRIAYLSHGRLLSLGDPSEMAERYANETIRQNEKGVVSPNGIPPRLAAKRRIWGTQEAFIREVVWLNADGTERHDPIGIVSGGYARLRIHYTAKQRIENPVFGFSIADFDGDRCIFGSNTQIENRSIPFIKDDGFIDLSIDVSNVHPGDYTVSFALHSADHLHNYHRLESFLWLRVEGAASFDGCTRLPVSWTC